MRERGQQAVVETLIFQAVETQRLIVAEAADKTKAARLARQKTKAALNDARRARSTAKLPLEEGKPATLPGSTDNGGSDRQALPYLVEEMPR